MTERNEPVFDSPTGWVAKYIRTYLESGDRAKEDGQVVGGEVR